MKSDKIFIAKQAWIKSTVVRIQDQRMYKAESHRNKLDVCLMGLKCQVRQ